MIACSLVLLALAAAPSAEVSTLKGEQHVGTLERLSSEELELKTPRGTTTLPAADLLSVRVPSSSNPAISTDPTVEIRLVDGTKLRATGLTSTTTEATINHTQLGVLKIAMASIQSIRFAPSDSKVDAAWSQLIEKNPKKDQVTVRKGDVLDHLDGVIGSFDEMSVKFQLDGDDIPVKRERVFGLIYAKRDLVTNKAVAAVELSSGDRLAARTVSFDGESWRIKLASTAELTVPMPLVQNIDFSVGKIAYLSNLDPREVKYTPFWDELSIWEYRRDRMTHGGPLSLGNKTYAKGLGIHSRTLLKYRVGGDYRRFQAVAGIDDTIRSGGDVDLLIKGDGRILFKGPVSVYERIDPKQDGLISPKPMRPQALDLDITGVVELEILVDFGELSDIGDCLDLADAKLVK